MKRSILYFEKPGPQNTDEVLRACYERAVQLGIKDIVVATAYGDTALKAAKVFDPKRFNLVAVTINEGFMAYEGWRITDEAREEMKANGIKVFTGIIGLGEDVNTAFTTKFGGLSPNRVLGEAYYTFCQGMKVCVEIILMAVDSGLIPVDKEVISVAGTARGADTAIVASSTYPRKFSDFKIKEIISKPRDG